MKIKRINHQTEEVEIALPYYFRTDGYTYKSYHCVADEKNPKQTTVTVMDSGFASIVCNGSNINLPVDHHVSTPEEFCEAFDKALKIQENILFTIAEEGGEDGR